MDRMSNAPKNQTYFYLGADYGLPMLILVVLLVAVTTLIGTGILFLTL